MCHNYLWTALILLSQLMSMTQRSNLKGFSSQTYFFHSTGHYNECVAAHNSVPPDPTMTVDNVTQILSKIPGHKWVKVMGDVRLDIPLALLNEIQRRYSTDTEKTHACADYYVNCHPEAGWEHLSIHLYARRQFAALKEKKSLIPTGKVETIIVLYSLKFSRLKIFMDFVDQNIATKVSLIKFQANNRCQAWLEVFMTFCLHKLVFE